MHGDSTCTESKFISFLSVCLKHCFETKQEELPEDSLVDAQKVKKTNADHNKTSWLMSFLSRVEK